MTLHITEHRDGFASGQTTITRYDEEEDNAGIALAVMKVAEGESVTLDAECETAWLLMRGKVDGKAGGREFALERTSLFDESSSCIHVSANTAVDMHCTADTEFTVYRCDNSRVGEAVLKVRNYDTVKILDEKDHAQCTVPGYGMYYSWVIRHLPGNPYTVPDFAEEHAWVMSPEQSFWDPETK